MRVTSREVRHARSTPSASGQVVTLIAGALLAIGALDHLTGSAPVQHLYYLPIIWAAIRFGRRGGLAAALVAIALYHLANPALLQLGHRGGDVVEVSLFLIVGLVTTKLAADADHMRLLAHTDDLTGLHNLRSFEARLGDLLEEAKRRQSPLSIMVLDLDRLKAINDAHGHLAGADAVRTAGEIIARQIPADAVACRYGGDEFVVALPDCRLGPAVEVAESIRRAVIGHAPTLAGHPLPAGTLSISAGAASRIVTPAEAHPSLGEELFREADEALYVAKAQGRNRVFPAAETGYLSSGSSRPKRSAMR
jgi:diguanylate cyclase (GGDEF)-like protein